MTTYGGVMSLCSSIDILNASADDMNLYAVIQVVRFCKL